MRLPILAAAAFLVAGVAPAAGRADDKTDKAEVPPSGQGLMEEKPPPTGKTLILIGEITIGTGVVGAGVFSLLCATGGFGTTFGSKTSCIEDQILEGAGLVAVGAPFLVVGLVQRQKYMAWQREHPFMSSLSLVPLRRGLALGYVAEF